MTPDPVMVAARPLQVATAPTGETCRVKRNPPSRAATARAESFLTIAFMSWCSLVRFARVSAGDRFGHRGRSVLPPSRPVPWRLGGPGSGDSRTVFPTFATSLLGEAASVVSLLCRTRSPHTMKTGHRTAHRTGSVGGDL